MSDKIITYAVPCYNSAEYMDHCVQTILESGASDIEILLVDDGSTDATADKADEWAAKEPGIIRAIHQENKGHGGAVMTGLANARGRFFKVVDSDDWVDNEANLELLEALRGPGSDALDLVITNYVIENVWEKTQNVMHYRRALRSIKGRVGSWSDLHYKPIWHPITMHAMTYRTEFLQGCDISLPEHTFYVDCLYAYLPLPKVQGLMYLDIDLYRYFIGRLDQSTNVNTIVRRIDQHLLVTELMIKAYDLAEVRPLRLRRIMEDYVAVLMGACTAYTLLSPDPEADWKRLKIWITLRTNNPEAYKRIRRIYVWCGSNYPGVIGNALFVGGFKVARRIFKFT